MSKQKLEEKYSLNIVGVLNVETMSIEVNERTIEIEELLKKVDKTEIKLSITKTEDIE